MKKNNLSYENIKFLVLVAGCRAGAEFFQSLLDGHSQILQFPGIIMFNKNFKNYINSSYLEIADNFIKNYKYFFDSRIKTVERHNMLGENKNEYYFVDQKKFKKIFYELEKYNKKKIFKNIIINLHLAYRKAADSTFDFNNVKYVLINTHAIYNTKNLNRYLENEKFTLIHSIRHPLAGIDSATNNWLNFENGKNFDAKDIFFQINLVTNAIKVLSKMKKNFFVIQLENIHQNANIFMNDLCNQLGIKKEEKLYLSTFNGKKWWGDSISGKFLSGINKNYKINKNYRYFTKNDAEYFIYLMKDYLIEYRYYEKISPKSDIKFSPFKSELATWKNSFRNKKIKHILSIPYFFLKRVLFINKYFCSFKNLPYSIGGGKKFYE